MRYMMMVQGSQADYDAMNGRPSPQAGPAWTRRDMRAMYDFMADVNRDLEASGELVDAQALGGPARTRWVSAGPDGRPVVRDDPYAFGREVAAGYWILECPSLARVTEIAARVARCPVPDGAVDHPVVIRPYQGGDGPV